MDRRDARESRALRDLWGPRATVATLVCLDDMEFPVRLASWELPEQLVFPAVTDATAQTDSLDCLDTTATRDHEDTPVRQASKETRERRRS